MTLAVMFLEAWTMEMEMAESMDRVEVCFLQLDRVLVFRRLMGNQ